MCVDIYGGVTYFRDRMPHSIGLVATQSFVMTASITMLTGSALPVALVSGGVAATATVVESVVRAIFVCTFPESGWEVRGFVSSCVAYKIVVSALDLLHVTYQANGALVRFFASSALFGAEVSSRAGFKQLAAEPYVF